MSDISELGKEHSQRFNNDLLLTQQLIHDQTQLLFAMTDNHYVLSLGLSPIDSEVMT